MCDNHSTTPVLVAKIGQREPVRSGSRTPLRCLVSCVGVDDCIAPLVALLNQFGYPTAASCCGHGHRPGNIVLSDGRELIIARNFDEARLIGDLFRLSSYGEPIEENPASQEKHQPREQSHD